MSRPQIELWFSQTVQLVKWATNFHFIFRGTVKKLSIFIPKYWVSKYYQSAGIVLPMHPRGPPISLICGSNWGSSKMSACAGPVRVACFSEDSSLLLNVAGEKIWNSIFLNSCFRNSVGTFFSPGSKVVYKDYHNGAVSGNNQNTWDTAHMHTSLPNIILIFIFKLLRNGAPNYTQARKQCY